MSVTVDCGEGKHDLCVGHGHTAYLFPQESRASDEPPFVCGCRCHHDGRGVLCVLCFPDAALHGPHPDMTGAELITAERQRQIEAEGWTPEHDDEHDACEMVLAAGCFVWHAVGQINGVEWPQDESDVPGEWPWHMDWWKPSADPIRNLEKAGALIAAEIDRLLRSPQK